MKKSSLIEGVVYEIKFCRNGDQILYVQDDEDVVYAMVNPARKYMKVGLKVYAERLPSGNPRENRCELLAVRPS